MWLRILLAGVHGHFLLVEDPFSRKNLSQISFFSGKKNSNFALKGVI